MLCPVLMIKASLQRDIKNNSKKSKVIKMKSLSLIITSNNYTLNVQNHNLINQLDTKILTSQ